MAKTRGCAVFLVAAIAGLLAAGSAVAAESSQGISQCDGRPQPYGIQDNSRPAPAGIQDNSRPGAKPVIKPPGGDAAIQDNSRTRSGKTKKVWAKPPAAGGAANAMTAKGDGG